MMQFANCLLIVGVLLASVVSGAQTIYRCSEPGGKVVLQDAPCAGGQPIMVNPASGADRPDSRQAQKTLKEKIAETDTAILRRKLTESKDREARIQDVLDRWTAHSTQYRMANRRHQPCSPGSTVMCIDLENEERISAALSHQHGELLSKRRAEWEEQKSIRQAIDKLEKQVPAVRK